MRQVNYKFTLRFNLTHSLVRSDDRVRSICRCLEVTDQIDRGVERFAENFQIFPRKML